MSIARLELPAKSSWDAARTAALEAALARDGAVLVRGLEVTRAGALEDFARGCGQTLLRSYPELPALPGGDSYRVTPYPARRWIEFHSEAAHRARWPLRLYFCCARPADSGGATPLVDLRRVCAALPPRFRARVEAEGLLYRRRFLPGLDQSWQEVFGTADPERVRALCRERGERCTFDAHGPRVERRAWPLRRPGGEPVFFSQLLLFHPRLLPAEVREAAALLFGEALPRDLRYGDGGRIDDGLVDELAALHHALAVRFPWQAGDVLVVDNLRCAHAREPYTGDRRHFAVLTGEGGEERRSRGPVQPA